MRIGKQMQFFGARANLAKALLYAINGGKDEKSGDQIAPAFEPITDEYLDYDKVYEKYDKMCDWLAGLYINTLNIIHYMHDKYAYEKLEMALHDEDIVRTSACGIAGFSVVVDSLSAIKYAKVKPIRNEDGLVVDYEIEATIPHSATTIPELTRLHVKLLRSSWLNLLSTTHIVIQSPPFQFLQSHQTLFMVRRQVILLTDAVQVSLLLPVLTPCTREIRTAA